MYTLTNHKKNSFLIMSNDVSSFVKGFTNREFHQSVPVWKLVERVCLNRIFYTECWVCVVQLGFLDAE